MIIGCNVRGLWYIVKHLNRASTFADLGSAQNVPNFMQIFGNFGKIVLWRPPWLATPPSGNPGSASVQAERFIKIQLGHSQSMKRIEFHAVIFNCSVKRFCRIKNVLLEFRVQQQMLQLLDAIAALLHQRDF